MTTGAPPNNISFMSTKRIQPNVHVRTHIYNEAGFIDHPLSKFGRVPAGGVILPYVGNPAAGASAAGSGPATHIGGSAWDIGHPHTVTGRDNGANY